MGLAARRHASANGFSRTIVVNALALLALFVLFCGELAAFHWSLSYCKWPKISQSSERPTRVLLLSDTHLEHPSADRKHATWSNLFYYLTNDLYLKRSWHYIMRKKPDVVIFLGDMLAEGKSTKGEEEYRAYVDSFHHTFPLKSDVDVYYLPGNDDVGMGTVRPLSNHVRQTYLRMFGPFNQQAVIHNHTFVLLDAPGLVDEDYTRAAQGIGYDQWTPLRDGPVEFVKTALIDAKPVILLSHIPLWRKDSAPCGPRREKGNIHQGVGNGYQNTLQKHSTEFLIEHLHPSIIFSGDNRDYCEHLHKLVLSNRVEGSVAVVPEITVKSFSPSKHIRRPGLQLLVLTNPQGYNKSFEHDLCLLPDRTFIHQTLYPGFACLTLFLLTLFNLRNRRRMFPQAFLTPLHPDLPLTEIPSSHPSLITATWTSHAPSSPVNPRGTFPGTIRTPNALSGPAFRLASRPGTPRQSATPILSPRPFTNEESGEDLLFPVDDFHHLPLHETWSQEYFNDIREEDGLSSMDHPFSNSGSARAHPGSLTWTFVLLGRRRRVALRLPRLSWDAVKNLALLLGDGVGSDVKFMQRGVVWSTIIDFSLVMSISAMIWTIMAWWSF
ncbi:hypothetical protein D9757_000710 [Collybiopsis confluens]|uniref:Calcineurin-like phosphoesterase domain-containing protein n=1 Tax=Collybiopsis confluens TaxID=2823264 RepID=A0A8H5MGN8_9AGAR|nr:hypothetical protein D9757_000710 [Collybiopsis confluens]